MTILSRTVDYRDGDTILEGFLAYNSTKPAIERTILIAHMWAGRVDFVCQKALQFAQLGYTAFALDMYGKGVIGQNKQENTLLMQQFIDDRELLLHRVNLALSTMQALPEVNPGNITAIGYCFGGMCVLDLARSGAKIKGVISVHGLLEPPRTHTKNIQTKILVLHGNLDPLANMDTLITLQNELTNSQADWQTVLYGNAMHAFTNPVANDPASGTVYNPIADKRSWKTILSFLDEVMT